MAKKKARKSRAGAKAESGPGKRSRQAIKVRGPVEVRVAASQTAEQVESARELFWQNVVREYLSELATMSALRPSRGSARGLPPGDGEARAWRSGDGAGEGKSAGSGGSGDGGSAESGPRFDPAMFDGRLALIMKNGDRIPIGHVVPLFACGLPGPEGKGASLALECSIFQVRTPDGHVFTLPVHEVRSLHALTPELIDRLERRIRRNGRGGRSEDRTDDDLMPFGFAAFTSTARGLTGPVPLPGAAPEEPTE